VTRAKPLKNPLFYKFVFRQALNVSKILGVSACRRCQAIYENFHQKIRALII
jgi:hypothetical protein